MMVIDLAKNEYNDFQPKKAFSLSEYSKGSLIDYNFDFKKKNFIALKVDGSIQIKPFGVKKDGIKRRNTLGSFFSGMLNIASKLNKDKRYTALALSKDGQFISISYNSSDASSETNLIGIEVYEIDDEN